MLSAWNPFDSRYGRIAVIVASTIFALALIDRASLLIVPCGIGGGGYSDHKSPNDDDCAARQGSIVAGVEWLSDQQPEFWTALATVAVAAFTLTLWLSTDKLWRAHERQFTLASSTAEQELRAYILVSGARVYRIDDPEQRTIKLSIRNFGKTPAANVKMAMGVGARPWPLHGPFPSALDKVKGGKDILPPGRPSLMVVNVPLTNAFEEREL